MEIDIIYLKSNKKFSNVQIKNIYFFNLFKIKFIFALKWEYIKKIKKYIYF